VGTTVTHSYPAVLADLSGLNVINSGVSGETTDRGLKRLPQELDRAIPDLLILIEGGNDILQNRSLSTVKKNLKAMIELAESRGVPVVLIGVPKKALFSDSAPLYDELAEDFQLVFDGDLIAELQRSPSLKSDRVHFNEKGYRRMAESIYRLLRENGALP
jgi:lysophospholipase L1-like esterase